MFNFIEKIQKIHLPFITSMSLYFDLGTATTRIAIRDKGIVLKEPTYLGYNSKIKEYIFFGNEAKTIVGKTPDFIKITRPLANAVLSDFDAEVALIKKCMEKSVHPYFSQNRIIKPSIKAVACVPYIATEIERKAVEEALVKAGCNYVYIMEKPLATASGCGFDIFSHHPHFIIDLGAGVIELSIVSGGGIVAQKTLKNAGDHMNKLIGNYTYLKHSMILGETTCEDLKISLLNFIDNDETTTVRGKSLETGLPKSVRMKTGDIREALVNSFNQIIDAVKEIIESSPPEIADEIFTNGIMLSGNIAKVKGIDQFFTKELKIDIHVSEFYGDSTIYGLMSIDKNPDNFFKVFGYK
jgi:rod shape-determining protein MreB